MKRLQLIHVAWVGAAISVSVAAGLSTGAVALPAVLVGTSSVTPAPVVPSAPTTAIDSGVSGSPTSPLLRSDPGVSTSAAPNGGNEKKDAEKERSQAEKEAAKQEKQARKDAEKAEKDHEQASRFGSEGRRQARSRRP